MLITKVLKVPHNIKIGLTSGSFFSSKLNYSYIWIFGIFGYLKKRIPNNIFLDLKVNWLHILGLKKCLIFSTYNLLKNFIFGLSKGFCFSLKIFGVGYKFKQIISKNWLMLKLGFSHIYRLKLETLKFKVYIPKRNFFSIYSEDNQYLKTLTSLIRQYRKPDIYKAKGILFFKEIVITKSGKKEQV